MKQHYVMPVGVDDFKKVREKYYYVDKTGFLKELVDDHAQATLITRPRRFGKTLFMSMLYYFFTLEGAAVNRGLFEGTQIESAGEEYMSEQGTRPVVFLSLKDIKEDSMEDMLAGFSAYMRKVYQSFRYLLEGDTLYPEEKEVFQAILSCRAPKVELQFSLSNLTGYLARFHKKKVLVLIDEYDAPIQSAWEHGYYPEAITFVRNYLSSVLKTNPDLDFAVLTGVLRIAKESIFSSLNNLEVASVASGRYAEAMGFAYEEVQKMAADFGTEDKMPEIKAWYDGYNFSGKEIYNPWSVVNYFKSNCCPAAYWANTSANGILQHIMNKARPEQLRDMAGLIQGGEVKAQLMEGSVYADIEESSKALYSMLMNTGYLTTVDRPLPYMGARTAMRIPNLEIRLLFQGEIMDRLEKASSDENLLSSLTEALLEGRVADFAEALGNFLCFSASYYDTANRESFYHGLILGLLATLVPAFEVVSNHESGYGRFDIAIFPSNKRTAGALLEFKVAEKEEELPERAREALAQIEENAYLTEFERRGAKNVWQYGIAFCGKKCHIESLMGRIDKGV